jgi:hypothetical protein
MRDGWIGSVLLGFTGFGFIMVYLLSRANWWGIIPGGVLLTLSMVALVESGGSRTHDGGPVFLAGMGLTFLAVYLAPTPKGRMRWALIPAGIFLVLGTIAAADTYVAFGAVWPLFLIAAGVYLLYRARVRQHA